MIAADGRPGTSPARRKRGKFAVGKTLCANMGRFRAEARELRGEIRSGLCLGDPFR